MIFPIREPRGTFSTCFAQALSQQRPVRRLPAFVTSVLPLALPLLLILALSTSRAQAEYPDWSALADVGVIEVLTEDADGDIRETKVWFVMLDGSPYLRTNGSRWLENIRRDPNIGLRIEGREYEARGKEIPGAEIVKEVDAASVEKYGMQEKLIHVFRMKKPDILLISPRAAES